MPELLRKVCGLTRPEDVALCHALGADFTGFIFAEKSPRRLSPEAVAALPKGPARRVGVFARTDIAALRESARRAGLDLVQLHGGEEPDFCRAVGPERVIKTL
ncbi:MAG: phosphoribosylanthranilate isomerase, partial [Deltaproteobacteria bacterium]|nr:phosphoribosylanthranilate isomerase [Deltaproteobacteria bacterium]